MKANRYVAALVACVSLCCVAGVSAKEHKKAPPAKKIVLTPDQLQWKEGPAAMPNTKMAVLEGDPGRRGFFTARLQLPAGTKIPPHLHENVERVTVISGVVNLAMGTQQNYPVALPAGSYFSLPPKTVHNAWVNGDTVVQITTEGPWSMNMVKVSGAKGMPQ